MIPQQLVIVVINVLVNVVQLMSLFVERMVEIITMTVWQEERERKLILKENVKLEE